MKDSHYPPANAALLHEAAECLRLKRNEDAVRAYARYMSGAPDDAATWAFNLSLARHRFAMARAETALRSTAICGHAPTPVLEKMARDISASDAAGTVFLSGLRPAAETDMPAPRPRDHRLAFDATNDFPGSVLEAALATPCDRVVLADSHFSTVVFALFLRILWGAEIRPAADQVAIPIETWQSRIRDLPRKSDGRADFSPKRHMAWTALLETFPFETAASSGLGALCPDRSSAVLFDLLGGWDEMAPAAETARLLQIDEADVVDFSLRLSGVAIHPDYPGMPVRLQVRLGTKLVARTIATAADQDNRLSERNVGFRFRIEVPVPETLRDARLTVWIEGAHDPVVVAVARKRPQTLVPPVPHGDVPREIAPDAEVLGKVERIDREFIRGWALSPAQPDTSVELVMMVDGAPCAYTRTRLMRDDVRKIHGGSGFAGFVFEIPQNLVVGRSSDIEIRALNGISRISAAHVTAPLPAGIMEPALLQASRCYDLAAGTTRPGRISVIMLNRNGAGLLRDMFGSCPEQDMTGDVEWIVVDHDSTDDSEAACAEFAARGGDVRFLRRFGNYSFSESNNFGARYATGEILLFANNDLIFRDAFAERLRDYMSDPEIGMVGIRLLDHVDDPAHQDLDLVQHLGVFFSKALNKNDWIRPYEARIGQETDDRSQATRAICVTGAFCAMHSAEFAAVGGFDEDYSYGLEDVDLCLKVHACLGKEVVCANDISVVHHRGFSRKQDTHAEIRRRRNNLVFNRRWGNWLRSRIRNTVLSDPATVTGSRPVIAFICADVGDDTWAGDYFTSLELGRALQGLLPCHVRYLAEKDWYDLADVDVLITMVNRFDLVKVKNASPWLVTVNWMRQWFDRWANHSSTLGYDFLLASSGTAARYLSSHLGRAVGVLPIAAGQTACSDSGIADPELSCDYSFTGSRFGPPREIEFQLAPGDIRGKGKVFGHNWQGTDFEPISAGPVPYSRIRDVYASTKIVLDDGNIATKNWGSCNSRVFDAMAAGCLLLTNSDTGVKELFGDLVPTFDSRETLSEQLNFWLEHEETRKERASKLQKIVREEHNYTVRAKALLSWMSRDGGKTRIAIKCAAKYSERAFWGDFHYAESLAAALRRLGHVVRVDCRETWDCGIANSDDVVIVLRGLVAYKPRPHQRNILWLISHPNDVTIAEMAGFDHVYVASQPHTEILRRDFGLPASFLPQCTDTSRFFLDEDRLGSRADRALYVANSRGIFRDPVRWAIQHELPIDIYGGGWEPFITDSRYRGKLVPNEVLSEFYGSSRFVICDHWDDMRQLGYVANRLFDVLASGGRLLIDRVAGLGELVPEKYISIYDTEDEFVAAVRDTQPLDKEQRREAAEWASRYHSFDARAREISDRIAKLMTVDIPASGM